MYINKNTYISDICEIEKMFEKAKSRFHDANGMIDVVNRQEMTLDINVTRSAKGAEVGISLLGLNDMITSLKCAINEYDVVLKILEDIPEKAAEFKKKINQPSR